jgi:hypothetical protein
MISTGDAPPRGWFAAARGHWRDPDTTAECCAKDAGGRAMLNLRAPANAADPLPLTELALARWLADAMPGNHLVYHRGFLAVDAAMPISTLPMLRRAELQRVAGRAMAAAEHGLVHLVQRRHGDGDFEYLLIARPRPTGRRSRHQVALVHSSHTGGTA